MSAGNDSMSTYAEYMVQRQSSELFAEDTRDISPEVISSGLLARRQQIRDAAWQQIRASGLGVAQQTGMDDTAPVSEAEVSNVNLQLQKVKDAGMAGIISYGIVQIAFWGASIPIGILGYQQATGHWPDLSNAEDQAKLFAEAFTFLNLARLAIPLRIALALSMTRRVQTGIVDKLQKED